MEDEEKDKKNYIAIFALPSEICRLRQQEASQG